jgi:hypothetical protein
MDLPNYHGYIGYVGIVVATLGGAAVGVERQRSGHATGTRARLGGVRTFTLLGGVAGLAGWLATLQFMGFALLLVAAATTSTRRQRWRRSSSSPRASRPGWAGWRSPAP